ncbi:myb-like protein A [Hyalella azteca]|uniref:Myb-like protein A n=1 Tax=Hyalella azteca TaxID=294128 RepID=A0A8B7NY65_HYAAZ|nr:myb-like protein A [Hyalella azteca]
MTERSRKSTAVRMFRSVDTVYPENSTSLMPPRQHSSNSNTFSSQSVLKTVQKFVTSVNAMNETVMVPCRLLDMDFSAMKDKTVPELLKNSNDPYAVYCLLNTTKNDLMYGPSTEDDDEVTPQHDSTSDRWSSPCDSSGSETNSVVQNSAYNTQHNGNSSNTVNNNVSPASRNSHAPNKSAPARRQSTLSMISVASSSSECSSECDLAETSTESAEDASAGLGSEVQSSAPETVIQVSAQLRDHLIGLQNCLTQLSETANFISDCYQEELVK